MEEEEEVYTFPLEGASRPEDRGCRETAFFKASNYQERKTCCVPIKSRVNTYSLHTLLICDARYAWGTLRCVLFTGYYFLIRARYLV